MFNIEQLLNIAKQANEKVEKWGELKAKAPVDHSTGYYDAQINFWQGVADEAARQQRGKGI